MSSRAAGARVRVRLAALAVVAAGGAALGLAASEFSLGFLYRHPALIPRRPASLLQFLKGIYFLERSVVQHEPQSVRYDPGIFYTLRPGRFTFTNVEFSVPFRVNSQGTRDDESALDHPEIVVIGDSFAMGWGVAQEKTFAKLIEAETGRPVLDAAVASYGTVREVMMLDRVWRPSVKTVVIQYCENDFDENDDFAANGNRFVPDGQARLEDAIEEHRRQQEHVFMRFTRMVVYHARKALSERLWPTEPEYGPPQPAAWPTPEFVARRFLNALSRAHRTDLTRAKLIVFDPDPHPGFIRAVERLHGDPIYPRYVREMAVVDLSSALTPDKFFTLDDHLNESGHRLVADALVTLLKRPR